MPLMGGQPHLADVLTSYSQSLPSKPAAILIITAHWIEDITTVSAGRTHPLLFDYSGFPRETYEYTYPASGSPTLADQVCDLLKSADIPCKTDSTRGWDHGVFVPLKLMFPDATVPVVAMSLQSSMDPELHFTIGHALRPLREQNILILGSGMSFHNFGYFFTRDERIKSLGAKHSVTWDNYLIEALTSPELSNEDRRTRLAEWSTTPSGIEAHPLGQQEHLIPLFVLAGCSGILIPTNTKNDETCTHSTYRCKAIKAKDGEKFSSFATTNFEWLS